MKTILILVIFSFCGSSIFGQVARRSCFISPAAGDIITSNETVNLKWAAASDLSGKINISFWNQKTGSWEYIGSSEYTSGLFQWSIPKIYGKSFRLRGIADNGDVMYSSGYFSIRPPSVQTQAKPTSEMEDVNLTAQPNPASKVVRLRVEGLPSGQPVTMLVFNEEGQVIAKLDNPAMEAGQGLCYTLDCSNFANGFYFARILNDQSRRSVKIAVSH